MTSKSFVHLLQFSKNKKELAALDIGDKMRTLSITGVSDLSRVKYRTFTKTFQVGPVSLNFLTVVIISILALFYLVQSQVASAKYNQIKELEVARNEVIGQNEALQIHTTTANSIENIKQTADSLGMEQTTEVNYLNTQDKTEN